MITPNSYSETLSKAEKTVSERVSDYLKEPSEENVHDLRTSIRRLLATMEILPKKIRRSKDSRTYLEGYQRLLKANTKVRDIDVLLSKLPSHGDNPAYSKLAAKLKHSRDSTLKRARRVASSLKDRNLSLKPADIPASTIQKRFKKTASTLAKKLRKRLQVVINEPKNIDEIHKLREDSRRLHFTLEMDNAPQASKLVPVLESWQELLGSIRDSDIFISHFGDHKDPSMIKEVVDQEKSGRKGNYEKFIEIAKDSPSFQ